MVVPRMKMSNLKVAVVEVGAVKPENNSPSADSTLNKTCRSQIFRVTSLLVFLNGDFAGQNVDKKAI